MDELCLALFQNAPKMEINGEVRRKVHPHVRKLLWKMNFVCTKVYWDSCAAFFISLLFVRITQQIIWINAFTCISPFSVASLLRFVSGRNSWMLIFDSMIVCTSLSGMCRLELFLWNFVEFKYFLIPYINVPNNLMKPCEEEESKYLYPAPILNRVYFCFLNLWKVNSQSTHYYFLS